MTFKLTALISFPQMPVSDSLSAVHDCSRLNKGYNTFGIDRTAVDTDFKMQVTPLRAFADRRVADAANDLTGGDSVADIHGRLSLQIGVNACHAVCVRDDDCDPESVVNVNIFNRSVRNCTDFTALAAFYVNSGMRHPLMKRLRIKQRVDCKALHNGSVNRRLQSGQNSVRSRFGFGRKFGHGREFRQCKRRWARQGCACGRRFNGGHRSAAFGGNSVQHVFKPLVVRTVDRCIRGIVPSGRTVLILSPLLSAISFTKTRAYLK